MDPTKSQEEQREVNIGPTQGQQRPTRQKRQFIVELEEKERKRQDDLVKMCGFVPIGEDEPRLDKRMTDIIEPGDHYYLAVVGGIIFSANEFYMHSLDTWDTLEQMMSNIQ
jgi:hypothetical protein